MKVLLITAFFLLSLAQAQEKKEQADQNPDFSNINTYNAPKISRKYRAGQWLIFDCKDSHFVCADQEGHESCTETRKKLISENKKNLACAPLKMFKSLKECKKAYYHQVHQPKIKVYCYGNRKREIKNEKKSSL
jgi:hypothetical protein